MSRESNSSPNRLLTVGRMSMAEQGVLTVTLLSMLPLHSSHVFL